RELTVPPNILTPHTQTITPEDLPLASLTQADINHIVAQVPEGISNIQDIYALSPLQEGILFHHLLAKQGDTYLTIEAMAFPSLPPSYLWPVLPLLRHLISDPSPSHILGAEVEAILDGRRNELAASQSFRNLVAHARLGTGADDHERFFSSLLGDIDEPTLPFG